MVRINDDRYGEFTPLLDKAMQAYTDGLGAGAVVYLRKIFEKITVKTAKAVDIKYDQYEGGNPKNFSDLLKRVDEKCSIIPKEFSENGYKLLCLSACISKPQNIWKVPRMVRSVW